MFWKKKWKLWIFNSWVNESVNKLMAKSMYTRRKIMKKRQMEDIWMNKWMNVKYFEMEYI